MNAIVVVAHGLHCHWLGPYGNEWVDTPAIDALACESVVFDHHFANQPSPQGFQESISPGLTSLLSNSGINTVFVDDRKTDRASRHSWGRSIRVVQRPDATPAEALASALDDAFTAIQRDQTLIWIETDRFLPPWDFEFETYQHYADSTGGFTEDLGGEETEIPEPTDDPQIGPIKLDLRHWHQLHNSFAAAVSAFDTEIGNILKRIAECGRDRSTSFVLTGSFGWPLGEHGIVGPAGSRMHEELVHLPLIARFADRRARMHRVDRLTQVRDLGASLTELLGRSASGSIFATPANAPERSEIWYGDGNELGLRTETFAYLTNDPKTDPGQIFAKPEDIWEVNDVGHQMSEQCEQAAVRLQQFQAG